MSEENEDRKRPLGFKRPLPSHKVDTSTGFEKSLELLEGNLKAAGIESVREEDFGLRGDHPTTVIRYDGHVLWEEDKFLRPVITITYCYEQSSELLGNWAAAKSILGTIRSAHAFELMDWTRPVTNGEHRAMSFEAVYVGQRPSGSAPPRQ